MKTTDSDDVASDSNRGAPAGKKKPLTMEEAMEWERSGIGPNGHMVRPGGRILGWEFVPRKPDALPKS